MKHERRNDNQIKSMGNQSQDKSIFEKENITAAFTESKVGESPRINQFKATVAAPNQESFSIALNNDDKGLNHV